MTLYRYQQFHFDDQTEIRMFVTEVLKETPCGYWFIDHTGRRRWTSKTARARYAYPDEGEAMVHLLRRSKRYREILQQRLSQVEETIRQAKVMAEAMRRELVV